MKKNPLIIYFQESFQELSQVTWPTRQQAIRLTVIALVFTLIAGIFIAAADYLFSLLVELAVTNFQK